MTEHFARISLNCVPNVGAAKVRSLINAFGSLVAAAKATPIEITQTCDGIGIELANAILEALNSTRGQLEVAKASTCGVTILTELSEHWPKTFEDLDSPPLCLYCAGNTAILNDPQIAIIGTRADSLYGKSHAKTFAHYLANVGYHITSGLAVGIDTAAHKGALVADDTSAGKAIAVVGSGLDVLYPQENRPLAREIVKLGGVVISEYPFGRHADPKTFPQRNRLIAALSDAILVIETARTGGTLITVEHAKRLKRPIFTIPGRIEWTSFQGNHKLAHDNIATLVVHPEQIISAIAGDIPLEDEEIVFEILPEVQLTKKKSPTTTRPLGLTPDEIKVWDATDFDGVTLDTICERTGILINQVLAITTHLQMRKKLRTLPGGLIARNPN
ncbi:MAG: DNA-processing protein DprA [bacterium]|nr:DNA-processing protein DprA [bacterium]